MQQLRVFVVVEKVYFAWKNSVVIEVLEIEYE